MRAGWPLVGRAEELAAVTGALAEGRSVVVAGVAGVGKSRLAQEAVASLGGTARWAAATASASAIPLGALARVLSGFIPSGEQDRGDLLRRATDVLAGGVEPLVVDDAHHLDDLSATLVHQLALDGRTPVLLTVRSREPCPDAVVALWKDGLAERVEVQPLARHEVEALLGAALDAPVDVAARDRLWALSEGNPLFLIELVAAGRELGFLGLSDGRWSWQGSLRPTDRLSELIEARLAGLAPRDREALEVLAVADRLPVTTLQALAPAADLALLEQRGLLTVERSGARLEGALAHPVHGEVLRTATGDLRGRELRARLADAVQASGGRRREDVLRVATWRLEAGLTADAGLALAAAEAANALLAHELAEPLARLAAAGDDGFAARLALAVALIGQGRGEEAEAELARLAAEAHTDQRRWAVAEQRVQALVFQLGRVAEAEAVLRGVEQEVTDPATLDVLRAERAHVLLNAGSIGESLRLTAPLVSGDVAEPARLRAVRAHGMALALSGRGEAALELALRALAGDGGGTEVRAPAWAAMVGAVALVGLGRFRELERHLEASPEEGSPGFVDRRAYRLLLRGRVALLRGRPRTAAGVLGEATALLRTAPHGRLPWSLGLLAEASALVGDVDTAEAALAEAEQLLVPGARQFEPDVRHAGIWVLAAAGELSAAVEAATDLGARCRQNGAVAAEAFALHAAARLGAAGAVVERLKELATEADGSLVPTFAEHAVAVVGEDGRGLDAVASRFDELGAELHAAEAAVQASAAHTAAGLRMKAAASSHEAALLAARCEGARTPALAAARAPAALTRREREVVSLAARGLSSSAIAEKLVLSVRTVEGHLYNSFGKLGVTRREDLAGRLDAGPGEPRENG